MTDQQNPDASKAVQPAETGTARRPDRRLSAILAADIAGYSRLMGEDEAATVRELRGHQAVVLPMLAEFGGRLIDTAGDGILAEFPSAVGAVECAVEIQKVMAARNEPVPESRRMRFRIGVNLGDVILEDNRIYGDGINIAARLEGIADPGGICVSSVVHEQIVGRLPLTAQDLGRQELKNIARPVRVFRVLMGAPTEAAQAVPQAPVVTVLPQPPLRRGYRRLVRLALVLAIVATAGGFGGWRYFLKGIAPIPERSFIVLPFENQSGDARLDSIADGTADNVARWLQQQDEGIVLAHNAAFALKGKTIDERELGHRFNMRYVIEGSVRRSGDDIIVSADLIDTATAHRLWTGQSDGQGADLDTIETRVSATLAAELAEAVDADEDRRAAAVPANDTDARNLLARAHAAYRHEDSIAALRRTLQLADKALAIDGDNVNGLSLAARARMALAIHLPLERTGLSEEAEREIRRAIALEPQHASFHITLGTVLRMHGQHEEARVEFARALELDPTSVRANDQLALEAVYAGRPAEGLSYANKAILLSANANGDAYRALGVVQFHMGQDDDALSSFRRAISLAPATPENWRSLVALLELTDRHDDLAPALAKLKALTPNLTVDALRHNSPSDSPAYLKRQERFWQALAAAGIPAE